MFEPNLEWHTAAKAYLERLAAAEYTQWKMRKRPKKSDRHSPSDYHRALIDCLNRNDEEGFKALKGLQGTQVHWGCNMVTGIVVTNQDGSTYNVRPDDFRRFNVLYWKQHIVWCESLRNVYRPCFSFEVAALADYLQSIESVRDTHVGA